MGRRGLGFLIVLLVVGGLLGSLIGTALGNIWPFINQGLPPIGFETVTIDLAVIILTFGLTLKFNVASTIGLFLALFFYFKL